MQAILRSIVPFALKSYFPIVELDTDAIEINNPNNTDTTITIRRPKLQSELVRDQMHKLRLPFEPAPDRPGKPAMTIDLLSVQLDVSKLTTVATGGSIGQKLPVEVVVEGVHLRMQAREKGMIGQSYTDEGEKLPEIAAGPSGSVASGTKSVGTAGSGRAGGDTSGASSEAEQDRVTDMDVVLSVHARQQIERARALNLPLPRGWTQDITSEGRRSNPFMFRILDAMVPGLNLSVRDLTLVVEDTTSIKGQGFVAGVHVDEIAFRAPQDGPGSRAGWSVPRRAETWYEGVTHVSGLRVWLEPLGNALFEEGSRVSGQGEFPSSGKSPSSAPSSRRQRQARAGTGGSGESVGGGKGIGRRAGAASSSHTAGLGTAPAFSGAAWHPGLRRTGTSSNDWNIIDPVSLRARVSVQQGLVAWAEGDRGPVYPPLAAADVHVGILRCKVQEAQVRFLGAVLHATLGNRTEFEGDAKAAGGGGGASIGAGSRSERAAQNASVATIVQRVQSATSDAGQLLGLDLGSTNRVLQTMSRRQLDAIPASLRAAVGIHYGEASQSHGRAGDSRRGTGVGAGDDGDEDIDGAIGSATSKRRQQERNRRKVRGRRWYDVGGASNRERRRRRVSSAVSAAGIGAWNMQTQVPRWILPPVPSQSRGRLWLRYVSIVCQTYMAPAPDGSPTSDVPGLVLNKVWLPGFVICDMTVYPETTPPLASAAGHVGPTSSDGEAAATGGGGTDASSSSRPTKRPLIPFHLRCVEMRPPRRSDAMLVEVLSQADLGVVRRAAAGAFDPASSSSSKGGSQPSTSSAGGRYAADPADKLAPSVVPSLARSVRSASRLAAAACVEYSIGGVGSVGVSSTRELARALTGPKLSSQESNEKRLLERILSQGEVLQCRKLATATLVSFARQLQQQRDQVLAMRELSTCGTCFGRAPAIPPPAPLHRMSAALAAMYSKVAADGEGKSHDQSSSEQADDEPLYVAPEAASLVCLPIPAWLWALQSKQQRSFLQSQHDVNSGSIAPTLNPNPPLRQVSGQALLVADANAVRQSASKLQVRQNKQRTTWLGESADIVEEDQRTGAVDLESLSVADATAEWGVLHQPGSIAGVLHKIAASSQRRKRAQQERLGRQSMRRQNSIAARARRFGTLGRSPPTMPRQSAAGIGSGGKGSRFAAADSFRRLSHSGHRLHARQGSADEGSEDSDDDSNNVPPQQQHMLPLAVATTGVRAVASSLQPSLARILLASDALVVEAAGGAAEESSELAFSGTIGGPGTLPGGPRRRTAAHGTSSSRHNRSAGTAVLRLFEMQGSRGPFKEQSSHNRTLQVPPWRGFGTVVELGMSAMVHPLSASQTLELWDAELSAARGTITFEGVHSLQPKFDLRLSMSQLRAELLRSVDQPLLGLYLDVVKVRGLMRPNDVYDGGFSVGAIHGDALFGAEGGGDRGLIGGSMLMDRRVRRWISWQPRLLALPALGHSALPPGGQAPALPSRGYKGGGSGAAAATTAASAAQVQQDTSSAQYEQEEVAPSVASTAEGIRAWAASRSLRQLMDGFIRSVCREGLDAWAGRTAVDADFLQEGSASAAGGAGSGATPHTSDHTSDHSPAKTAAALLHAHLRAAGMPSNPGGFDRFGQYVAHALAADCAAESSVPGSAERVGIVTGGDLPIRAGGRGSTAMRFHKIAQQQIWRFFRGLPSVPAMLLDECFCRQLASFCDGRARALQSAPDLELQLHNGDYCSAAEGWVERRLMHGTPTAVAAFEASRAVASCMLQGESARLVVGSTGDGGEPDPSVLASASAIEEHAQNVVRELEAEARASRVSCVSMLPPIMGYGDDPTSLDSSSQASGGSNSGRGASQGVLRQVPSLRGSLARRWNRWLVATIAPDLIRLWRRCEEVVTHVDGNDAKRIAGEAWVELMTARAPSGAEVPSKLAHHAAAMLMAEGHVTSCEEARLLKRAMWTEVPGAGRNKGAHTNHGSRIQCLYQSEVELCWPPDVTIQGSGLMRQALRFVGLENAVDAAVQAANDLGGGGEMQAAGKHPLAQLLRKWGSCITDHSVAVGSDGTRDEQTVALGVMQEGVADVMRQLQEQIERLLDLHCMAAFLDCCWVPEWTCTSWSAQQLGRPVGAFAPRQGVIEGLQTPLHDRAHGSIASSIGRHQEASLQASRFAALALRLQMELAAGRNTGRQLGAIKQSSGRRRSTLLTSPEAVLADTRWGSEPGILATGLQLAEHGSDGAVALAVRQVRQLLGNSSAQDALVLSEQFRLPEQVFAVSHLRCCVDIAGSYAVRGGGAPARCEDGISDSVLPKLLDAERATEVFRERLHEAMDLSGGDDSHLLSMHHQDANSLLIAALQELQAPTPQAIRATGRATVPRRPAVHRGIRSVSSGVLQAKVDGKSRLYDIRIDARTNSVECTPRNSPASVDDGVASPASTKGRSLLLSCKKVVPGRAAGDHPLMASAVGVSPECVVLVKGQPVLKAHTGGRTPLGMIGRQSSWQSSAVHAELGVGSPVGTATRMQMDMETDLQSASLPRDHVLVFSSSDKAEEFINAVRKQLGGIKRGATLSGATDSIHDAVKKHLRERLFDGVIQIADTSSDFGRSQESTLGISLLASVFEDASAAELVPERIPQRAANASFQCGVSSLRLMMVPEVAMHSLAFIERARLAWVLASFLFPRVNESLQSTNVPQKELLRVRAHAEDTQSESSSINMGKGGDVGAGAGEDDDDDDGDYEEEERKSGEWFDGSSGSDGEERSTAGDALLPSERVRSLQLRIRPAVNIRLDRLTIVATEYREQDKEQARQTAYSGLRSTDGVDGEDREEFDGTQRVRLGGGLSALQIDIKGLAVRTAGARRNATRLMQAPAICDALSSVLDGDPPVDGLLSAVIEPQIGVDLSLEQVQVRVLEAAAVLPSPTAATPAERSEPSSPTDDVAESSATGAERDPLSMVSDGIIEPDGIEPPWSLRESGQIDDASDVLPIRFEADEWLSGLAVRWCSTLLLLEGLRVSGVLMPGGAALSNGDSESDNEGRSEEAAGVASESGASVQGGAAVSDQVQLKQYPPLLGLQFSLQHAGVMLSAGTGKALIQLAQRWANLPLQVLQRVRSSGTAAGTSMQPAAASETPKTPPTPGTISRVDSARDADGHGKFGLDSLRIAVSLAVSRISFVLEGNSSAMHRTVRQVHDVLSADRLVGLGRLDEASLAAASYSELLRLSGHGLDIALLATVARGADLESIAFDSHGGGAAYGAIGSAKTAVQRAFAPGSATAIARLYSLQAWEPLVRRSARYHGSSVCTGGVQGRSRGRHLATLVGNGRASGPGAHAARIVLSAGLDAHPLVDLVGSRSRLGSMRASAGGTSAFADGSTTASPATEAGRDAGAMEEGADGFSSLPQHKHFVANRLDRLRPTLELDVDVHLGRIYLTLEWDVASRIAIALEAMKESTLPALADLAAVPSQVAQLLTTQAAGASDSAGASMVLARAASSRVLQQDEGKVDAQQGTSTSDEDETSSSKSSWSAVHREAESVLSPQFVACRLAFELEQARLGVLAFDTPLAVVAFKQISAGASATAAVEHGAEDAFSFLAPSSSASATNTLPIGSSKILKRQNMTVAEVIDGFRRQVLPSDGLREKLPDGTSVELSFGAEFIEAVLARPTQFGQRSANRKRKQRKQALIRRGDDEGSKRLKTAKRTAHFWREALAGSSIVGDINYVDGADSIDAAWPPLPVLQLLTRANNEYWSGVPGGTVSISAERTSGSVRASSFANQQTALDVQAAVRRIAMAAEQDPTAVPEGVRACMFHSDKVSDEFAAEHGFLRPSAHRGDRRTFHGIRPGSYREVRSDAGSTPDGAWGHGAPLRISRFNDGLFEAPPSRQRLATVPLGGCRRWHAAYRAWPIPEWQWEYGRASRDHTPRVILRLGPCRSPQSVQRIVKRFVALKRQGGRYGQPATPAFRGTQHASPGSPSRRSPRASCGSHRESSHRYGSEWSMSGDTTGESGPDLPAGWQEGISVAMLLPTAPANRSTSSGRRHPVSDARLDSLDMDMEERAQLMQRLARDEANPFESVLEIGAGSLHIVTDPTALFQLHETIGVISEILGTLQFSAKNRADSSDDSIPTTLGQRADDGPAPSQPVSRDAGNGAYPTGGAGSDDRASLQWQWKLADQWQHGSTSYIGVSAAEAQITMCTLADALRFRWDPAEGTGFADEAASGAGHGGGSAAGSDQQSDRQYNPARLAAKQGEEPVGPQQFEGLEWFFGHPCVRGPVADHVWLVGQAIEVEVSSRSVSQHQAWELEWREGRGIEKNALPGKIEWVQTHVQVADAASSAATHSAMASRDLDEDLRPSGTRDEVVLVALRHDQAPLPPHMSIHIRMGGASITDVSPSPSTQFPDDDSDKPGSSAEDAGPSSGDPAVYPPPGTPASRSRARRSMPKRARPNHDLARPTGPVGLGGRRVGWVKRNAAFAWTPPVDPLSVDAPNLMFPLRVAFRKSMAATTAAVRRRLQALGDGGTVAEAVQRLLRSEAGAPEEDRAFAEARMRAMIGFQEFDGQDMEDRGAQLDSAGTSKPDLDPEHLDQLTSEKVSTDASDSKPAEKSPNSLRIRRRDLLAELFRPNGLGSSVWFARDFEWTMPDGLKQLVALAMQDAEREAERIDERVTGGQEFVDQSLPGSRGHESFGGKADGDQENPDAGDLDADSSDEIETQWLGAIRAAGDGDDSGGRSEARARTRKAMTRMRAYLREELNTDEAAAEVVILLVLGSDKVPGLAACSIARQMNSVAPRTGLLSVRHRVGGPRLPVAALPILALMSSERHKTAQQSVACGPVERPGHGKFPVAVDIIMPVKLPDFVSAASRGSSEGQEDGSDDEEIPPVEMIAAPKDEGQQLPARIPSRPIDTAREDPGCGSDAELFAFDGTYRSREDRQDDTLPAAYTPPLAQALEDYPDAFKMEITVCADQGSLSFVPRFVLKEFAPSIGLTIDAFSGKSPWAALDMVPRPPTNAPISLRILASRIRALVPPRCDLDGQSDGDRELTGHPPRDGGTRPGSDASLPKPTMLLAAARAISIGLSQRVGAAVVKSGVRLPSSRKVEDARRATWAALGIDVDSAMSETWSVEGHPSDPCFGSSMPPLKVAREQEATMRRAMRIVAAERMHALRVPQVMLRPRRLYLHPQLPLTKEVIQDPTQGMLPQGSARGPSGPDNQTKVIVPTMVIEIRSARGIRLEAIEPGQLGNTVGIVGPGLVPVTPQWVPSKLDQVPMHGPWERSPQLPFVRKVLQSGDEVLESLAENDWLFGPGIMNSDALNLGDFISAHASSDVEWLTGKESDHAGRHRGQAEMPTELGGPGAFDGLATGAATGGGGAEGSFETDVASPAGFFSDHAAAEMKQIWVSSGRQLEAAKTARERLKMLIRPFMEVHRTIGLETLALPQWQRPWFSEASCALKKHDRIVQRIIMGWSRPSSQDAERRRGWESESLVEAGVGRPKWAIYAGSLQVCVRQVHGEGAKLLADTQLAIDVVVPAAIYGWSVPHAGPQAGGPVSHVEARPGQIHTDLGTGLTTSILSSDATMGGAERRGAAGAAAQVARRLAAPGVQIPVLIATMQHVVKALKELSPLLRFAPDFEARSAAVQSLELLPESVPGPDAVDIPLFMQQDPQRAAVLAQRERQGDLGAMSRAAKSWPGRWSAFRIRMVERQPAQLRLRHSPVADDPRDELTIDAPMGPSLFGGLHEHLERHGPYPVGLRGNIARLLRQGGSGGESMFAQGGFEGMLRAAQQQLGPLELQVPATAVASLPLTLALPFATRAQASLHRYVLDVLEKRRAAFATEQASRQRRESGAVAAGMRGGRVELPSGPDDFEDPMALPLPVGWRLPGRTTASEFMAELTSRSHLLDFAGRLEQLPTAEAIQRAGLPFDWEAKDAARAERDRGAGRAAGSHGDAGNLTTKEQQNIGVGSGHGTMTQVGQAASSKGTDTVDQPERGAARSESGGSSAADVEQAGSNSEGAAMVTVVLPVDRDFHEKRSEFRESEEGGQYLDAEDEEAIRAAEAAAALARVALDGMEEEGGGGGGQGVAKGMLAWGGVGEKAVHAATSSSSGSAISAEAGAVGGGPLAELRGCAAALRSKDGRDGGESSAGGSDGLAAIAAAIERAALAVEQQMASQQRSIRSLAAQGAELAGLLADLQ